MHVRSASRFSWSLTAQLRSSCLGVVDLQPVHVKGHGVKVTIFDTQRDFTARQDVHTRFPCTHSKAIGHYYSREALKP